MLPGPDVRLLATKGLLLLLFHIYSWNLEMFWLPLLPYKWFTEQSFTTSKLPLNQSFKHPLAGPRVLHPFLSQVAVCPGWRWQPWGGDCPCSLLAEEHYTPVTLRFSTITSPQPQNKTGSSLFYNLVLHGCFYLTKCFTRKIFPSWRKGKVVQVLNTPWYFKRINIYFEGMT